MLGPMRTRQIAGSISAALMALTMAGMADAQEKGELTIYERESQIGVAAKREYPDADDLDVLAKRASSAAKTVPNLDTEGLLVKCYSGVNHLHHGLLENGVGEFSSRPAPGVYFTEHCFNKDGKLVKAVVNQEDGTQFVSRTFLYEDGQPAGMLTFGIDEHSFSDVGLYKEGRLSLVARIAPAGNVMSCERIFYTGDRKDYSVRYVATQTSAKFTVSYVELDVI